LRTFICQTGFDDGPERGQTTRVEWLQPEQQREEFVDAERIWLAIDGAASAQSLYEIAGNRFEGLRAATTIDAPALDALLADGFIEIPNQLSNAIDSYRRLVTQSGPYRAELEQIYRRIRTGRVQLRRADKERDQRGGLFKSKPEQWNSETRRDTLIEELNVLQEKKTRIEGELEKSGTLLRTLLDQVNQEPRLRSARWFGERPVVLTYDGQFLRDFLADMNPANFHGRSLAEILEIGGSLA
jgi:hypothetical protein